MLCVCSLCHKCYAPFKNIGEHCCCPGCCTGLCGAFWGMVTFGSNRKVFGVFPEGSVEQANRSQIVTVATDNEITGMEI